MTGIWIDFVLDIVIIICLLAGTLFIFSTSIGILRFPDIFTRLHAATKAGTLGVSGIMIGAFLFLYVENGIVSGKLILGIIFVLLTAPVSGHMISRAAYHSGIKPWSRGELKDDYAKELKARKESNL